MIAKIDPTTSTLTTMAPLRLAERRNIATDTINRSAAVTHEHLEQGASADSIFIADQLPPLDSSKSPGHPQSNVAVVNADAFTIARGIMNDDADAIGKTTVLNLASDIYRAGGWEEILSTTQVSTDFKYLLFISLI